MLLEISCVCTGCFIRFYCIGLCKIYLVFHKVEFLPVIANQSAEIVFFLI